MKTASGHEFEVAWNPERLDVVIAVDFAHPISDHWIRLTPEEARNLGDYLHNMAEVCEKRARHQTIIAAVDGTAAAAQLDAMAAPLNPIAIDKP